MRMMNQWTVLINVWILCVLLLCVWPVLLNWRQLMKILCIIIIIIIIIEYCGNVCEIILLLRQLLLLYYWILLLYWWPVGDYWWLLSQYY